MGRYARVTLLGIGGVATPPARRALRDPNFVADFGPARPRGFVDVRFPEAGQDARVARRPRGHHRGGLRGDGRAVPRQGKARRRRERRRGAAHARRRRAVVACDVRRQRRRRATSRGADAAARNVGAAIAGGDRYCASFAWRAVAVFEEALRSEVPSVRAAAAGALARKDPTGRNDFADVCAALLFRRHDVGVRRPAFFDLRRWWDVALAEPEYRAANAARETGLTRAKKLDAAWRGAYLTPWPETRAPGARAARDGRRPNRNRPRRRTRRRANAPVPEGARPHGRVARGTPLAEAGLERADARAESLKELRARSCGATRRGARRARTADKVSETVTSDVISDVQSSSGSDDSDSGFDLADGSDEGSRASLYAPDVTARRRARAARTEGRRAHGVTAAASAAAALRRVAPARRSRRNRRQARGVGSSCPSGRPLGFARRARHDRLRVTRANRTLASLLDAALGGEGDEVRAANEDLLLLEDESAEKGERSADGTARAELAATAAADDGRITAGHTSLTSLSATGRRCFFFPVPALTYREMALVFLGVVVERRPAQRRGAPAGASGRWRGAAALALGGGGVPAFLKTDYVVLRSDGSEGKRSASVADVPRRRAPRVRRHRPPLVASRASSSSPSWPPVGGCGTLLRRLAEVMADAAAAPTRRRPRRILTALDEDARVTVCVRALGLARRADELGAARPRRRRAALDSRRLRQPARRPRRAGRRRFSEN